MGASGERVADENRVVPRGVQPAVALVRDGDRIEAAAAREIEAGLAHVRVARLDESQAVGRA